MDAQIQIDDNVLIADFPAVDGRRMVYIYHFGPGDSVRMPAAMSVKRNEDGGFAKSNVDFELTINGDSIETRTMK